MQRKETTEIQKGFAAIFAEIIKCLLYLMESKPFDNNAIASVIQPQLSICASHKLRQDQRAQPVLYLHLENMPPEAEEAISFLNPGRNNLYSTAFSPGCKVFIYNGQDRLVNECQPDNA